MKTILIIISGLADVPVESLGGKTPLMAAATPALDALSKCGCMGLVKAIDDRLPLRPANAAMSILGYDFARGVPRSADLAAYATGKPCDGSAFRYFVIPKFSGHGVVITDNDTVRGVGMTALLRPLFTMDGETGQSKETPCGTLDDKAMAAIKTIEDFDFVAIYVDGPRLASLSGDVEAKIKAIEEIDSKLIAPLADHVWNSKLQMCLAVTSDYPMSVAESKALRGEVPSVVYFNDDLPYDNERFDEQTAKDGPLGAIRPGELIRYLATFEPVIEDNV